jgi:hypothetical protein
VLHRGQLVYLIRRSVLLDLTQLLHVHLPHHSPNPQLKNTNSSTVNGQPVRTGRPVV